MDRDLNLEPFGYWTTRFTIREGKMERDIHRWIVVVVLRWCVVVKKELSRMMKLLIYESIYVPTLTKDHELCLMTERTLTRMQVAEMNFLQEVAWHILKDRVVSSVTWKELGEDRLLFHIEKSQLKNLGHLFQTPPWRDV